jgi:hypothetical protein
MGGAIDYGGVGGRMWSSNVPRDASLRQKTCCAVRIGQEVRWKKRLIRRTPTKAMRSGGYDGYFPIQEGTFSDILQDEPLIFEDPQARQDF